MNSFSVLLVTVGRIKLILDELLEMKDNNESQIEIDNVVLSVAGLIYLINKLFLSWERISRVM